MALGGTIQELQRKMSIAEYTVWLSYRKKYGPMNDVRRYDRPAALMAYVQSGGKAKMKDFMPYGQEADQVAGLEDIIKAFGGANIVKSR